MLSQHCETLQFISHFASWPDLNFDLAPPTFQPILRNLHLLELTPPTVKIEPTDMKVSKNNSVSKNFHTQSNIFQIYRVEGNDRRPLPPVPSSHLSAGGVYMFQWTVCHASPLYTWVETAMCVWVGSRAGDYWTAVESCRKYTEREIVSDLTFSFTLSHFPLFPPASDVGSVGFGTPTTAVFFQGDVGGAQFSSFLPSPISPRHPSPSHTLTRGTEDQTLPSQWLLFGKHQGN